MLPAPVIAQTPKMWQAYSMNKRAQRLNTLISMLRSQGSMYVSDIAKRLDVSEMTVRRDLHELQGNNVLERHHGKALFLRDSPVFSYEDIENIYSLSSASQEMNGEKKRIAQYAVTMIKEGEVIIIDNGSTTDKIADYIPDDITLTVACYNLNIAAKLSRKEKVNILLAGGYYHQSDQMFESFEGLQFLRSLRAHKLFISASGVHESLGMTCAHSYEVRVKQTVLESALEKILVADSSKFGAIKTVFFSSIENLDMIITDNGISEEWIEVIRNRGIKLATV
jgi:DeoR family deoxyribose operon repressor